MSNTDVDFDELEDEQDDDSPVIRKLRTQLRNARKDSKDAADLRAKLHEYESRDALSEAGLDLNARQQRALIRELDDPTDLSAETLRKVAVELGFVDANDGQDATDAAAQAAIAAASAGAAVTAADGLLKPAEFAAWDMARRVDFMERHPEKFAAIERGETVRL